MMTPLEWLQELADANGTNLKELTVLANQNDPFRIGTPTQVIQAQWFADVWRAGKFPQGMHIRGIHY